MAIGPERLTPALEVSGNMFVTAVEQGAGITNREPGQPGQHSGGSGGQQDQGYMPTAPSLPAAPPALHHQGPEHRDVDEPNADHQATEQRRANPGPHALALASHAQGEERGTEEQAEGIADDL